LIVGWFCGQDDDCKWFQWIDDERTSREKALCGFLLDKLKRNATEMVEKERILQEHARVFEEKAFRRKEKILKLQKDQRRLIEENFQLKIKFQESRIKENKFVKSIIVLGLSCFMLILWLMKNEGSIFKYLALP